MSNKNVRISLRVTPELWALMEQIMRKEGRHSINDFVQACIRAYIDETGDIIGSRRHFNKSMIQNYTLFTIFIYYLVY